MQLLFDVIFNKAVVAVVVVAMLNIIFLSILILYNILIAAEQSNKCRIKNCNGIRFFKTLYYFLHNLTYSNWNELIFELFNLPYWHIHIALQTRKFDLGIREQQFDIIIKPSIS